MKAVVLLALSVFAAEEWKGFITITVQETAGLARENEPVDVAITVPVAGETGLFRESGTDLVETPVQAYRAGRFFFYADAKARETVRYRLCYGGETAKAASYASAMKVEKWKKGPRHLVIENGYYKAETMPKSGQVWHLWDKKGGNTMWYHNEWKENNDKGGDPVHWAPNCWVGYPERTGARKFDWHYVVGWESPEYELVEGPLFLEFRRKGVIKPHPEHTDTTVKRDKRDLTYAEVTYRFYDRLPYYFESSTYQVLEDISAYFIRNNQMVFKTFMFDHMFILPENKGLLPGDEGCLSIFPLMGHFNRKPFKVEHSLSNILPSKLAYYGYYNSKNADGFANFQIRETNTNVVTGNPSYYNHAMIFTEAYDWSTYCARTFSYTNRRFNPENAVRLPKGEKYYEENFYAMFRYEGPQSLAALDEMYRRMNSPLSVKIGP